MALGALILRLENSGFIERRGDANDGRTRRVFLTAEGQRLIAAIRETVEDSERELLSKVGAEDLEISVATLRVIRRRLLDIIEAEDATG